MLIARRALLASLPLAAAYPRAAWAQNLSRGVFTHGVASGDPLPDGIILWTRFVGGDGRIAWEIGEDESFTRIVRRGESQASVASDYCVKVDVRGLAPGRRYVYRFLSASGPSLVGETRTAPAAGGDALNIALFSCSNYAFGYFHAYAHAAAREDIDLALHVGDYIYETARGVYPATSETAPGRIIDPFNEIVTLGDYYQRYATYHTDAGLLELRRRKPLSAVWDDHELVNDTWRGGARDHQDYEGDFLTRIAAAAKAYFDWMPIRRPEPRTARLYRALDWGDLARIVLLDTRYLGRDQQLDYRNAPQLLQGGAESARAVQDFRALLNDPQRSMLGAAQEQWFAETLAQSKQRGQSWQIVAQQVVLGEQIAPAGLTSLLAPDVASGSRQWFSAAEQASALGLPWNLDSWNGYPAARARFLQACAQHANNAVVLGGDSHNCWVSTLAAPSEPARVAVLEFAGGSVASPGFERSLTNAAPGERERVMRGANPALAFCDLTYRGYGKLRFTPSACEAEWMAFADVRTPLLAAPTTTRLRAATQGAAGPTGWSLI